MPEKIVMAWSGGKDSAMAYRAVAADSRYEIVAVLTTVTGQYDRISMHGVRRDLLEAQARMLGKPLEQVVISPQASNVEYEQQMARALAKFKTQGVAAVGFGDLFLQDVRKYREEKMAQTGMRPVFPVWGLDTRKFAQDFIEAGFKAVLTCVDGQQLNGKFAGREYDQSLLEELPPGVDPCGENGEFHTFVYAGPIFAKPIPIRRGEVVLRDNRFWYCDFLPAQARSNSSRDERR